MWSPFYADATLGDLASFEGCFFFFFFLFCNDGDFFFFFLLYKIIFLFCQIPIIHFHSPMVQETGVQSQVASYQRLLKWFLIPPCLTLSNIRYVSRVKWSNPGKGVAPFPTPRCSSYWKGSLLVALDCGHQLYLYTAVISSASEDNGCRLFVYRIYEVFHINLWECSMYGYCYIFLFRFI